jgi:hypothetical protein
VWVGLAALVGAQVWDVLRVRLGSRGSRSTPGPAPESVLRPAERP